MRYFLDGEFIEDGKTIDLLSLALVAEDGRELYLQNADADFSKASDWVWRHVYPSLEHFEMAGRRKCTKRHQIAGDPLTAACTDPKCPWRFHFEIRDRVREFCEPDKHPEFWGYYADYDWVAFCQLFGP